jgi:hypothetical protein
LSTKDGEVLLCHRRRTGGDPISGLTAAVAALNRALKGDDLKELTHF